MPVESYSEYSARVQLPDQLDSLRSYADYARLELAKTGELTDEVNNDITQSAFRKAVELGAVEAPADEEQANSLFSEFRKRPANPDILQLTARALEDSGDKTGAESVRAYWAVQDPKIKSQYPDEATYGEALANAKAAADPYIADESKAKRYAVGSGLAKFASYEDKDGTVRVVGDSNLSQLSDEELASYAAANPQFVNPEHLPAVKRKFSKIDGFDITPAQIERKSELAQQLSALAKSDAGFDRAVSGVRAGFVDSERSGGQLAVDAAFALPTVAIAGLTGLVDYVRTGNIQKTAPMAMPASQAVDFISDAGLLKRYSKDEIAAAVNDMAIRSGVDDLTFDEANPAAVVKPLSDGTLAMPVRVMANKQLFDSTLEKLPASDAQKNLLKRERTDKVDAYAKLIIPQLIEADDSILNVYNEQKASGKNDGDILEYITSNKKYSGVTNRLENFGLALTKTVTDLIPAVGAVLPDFIGEPIKEAGYGIAKKLNSEMAANNALAAAFGKDMGWTQQLVEQVPQLAADILISRGAGRAAGAVSKTAARASAILAPELTAKLARFSAARLPAVVGKEVGADIASKLSTVPNEIGWLVSQGARTFGSTYVSTRSALEAQVDEAGRPKFTPEQIDNVATETAVQNALVSNAITLGFNHIAGGQFAGSETLAAGRGFSTRNLKSFYDDLQAGVRQLPADLRNEIKLTDFNTFVKDSVKASLKPYTRVVFGAAGEGAEEFAQNVAQDVITNNSLDKDFDLRESTRAAALAASFGAALGGASTGISELETRYLREPAYQQADFEESYLKRSIDQLRKANSPATADFLEGQLSLAQSKKTTIRQQFTSQAALESSLADNLSEAQRRSDITGAPTPEARPNGNLLPAPTEGELLPSQVAELNRLSKHRERLERILTEASGTPEPTEAQLARIAELQNLLDRTNESIANVPNTIELSGEAGPKPERIDFPVSPLPAYDPVTGVTITGAAIEREGQFEMPFMADWVSLESKPAELADEDNVIEASINDAQLEFGIEPAAIEIESKDKVLSDISASVPVAKLVTFNRNATPELRAEFQNTVAMAESTHDDITRYSKERELLTQRIPAFEANIESLIARTPTLASEQTLASYKQRLASANARVAEIDSELESLQADRSGLTARIKQLASKPADDIADVVGRILENVEVAPEAAAKEITKKTSKKKAAGERPSKATSVAKDIDVAATEAAIEAIEMAEETSTPAETLAVAVEAAQKKQSKRKAKAAAPASVSENAQIAEAITEADVGATETQLTASEIRDSAIQMLVDAGIMSREEGLEAVKEKLKKKLAATKFTAEDALPLVDLSEPVTYKVKGGTKTTGKYLKSFSKPTDFLTTEDFEKFNSYLAAGTYPKSIVLQKQELASGSQAYVIPFFNTIEREIANRYPTIPAPEVAVDPTLSQDQIYNPITGITVFRSGLSEQRLINARKSIRFEIKRLIDKRWQSPKQVEEWNAAVQKAKSELAAISIRLQNVDSAAHAKAALERESLREWLKQTVPDKASKLKRDIWENDAAPVRARLSELDDIISGLETETPILAEFAAKTDELARLNNDRAFTEKEWVAKIKVAKDALLQLNQRIADYAKTGDLIIERKTERAARMKDEIDTTLRKKIGGELERVHLPVEQREDGTYIGAHTNVPEDAARLLDHGFSIFVAPKLRKKKNPAIKLDKNGFVKSVTLADGRVIKSAGDMRSLIEDSYVAEESGEDHMKFAFNLPAVTPAVAPLIGKDTAGFNDEKFVTAAFAYLRDAKSSKLRDIRGQLLAADESYDEFANAVLTRHLRTIREFSLAVRIRQTVNRGRSVDKLMQRLFVVDGQIQPDIRRMLVSKYGENSDKMLLYTYASQLNNELGESFTPEVGDEDVPVADASESALLTPEESGKISRRWINGRPAALDTQVNNVWTNFSKALSRREVVWHSELPNENVLEDVMTSPQMEEAVGDIIGGMEAAFIALETAADERIQSGYNTIDFRATGDTEADMDQLDAVINRTYDALNDSTIRAAFEEVAKAFGVTNIKRKSNKELVELLRDETSATAEKARAATQKLVAKEVNKLVKAELKKNKALDPDKVRERLTREVERNIAQERAASVDVESARIVKSYITPLAEFSKAVKDTAADIERNKAIRETRKWEQQTYGRAGLSSETVALIEGTKQYKAQPIETPVITPEQTLERVSAVTLPDGTVWSRAQLRDIAEKMRTVSESDQYTEDKRSQYGKFADKIEETLAGTKKRNITVGRDIFFAKAKNTPTDIARIIRENSVEIALLEIQSGDTASMIAALDKVSSIHKDVAALLKTRADILANVSIEFVTMPNSGWAGQYAADSNTIYINRAATNGISVESTLLHEMLHAVTAYSINNPDTAAAKMLLAKLESLRSKALEAAVGNGETDLQFLAGLSDVHEFVSYMMTSPDFQRKLLEVDSRNFLRRFIDSVISFFTGRRDPATVATIRDIVELVGMSNARPYGTNLSEDVARTHNAVSEEGVSEDEVVRRAVRAAGVFAKGGEFRSVALDLSAGAAFEPNWDAVFKVDDSNVGSIAFVLRSDPRVKKMLSKTGVYIAPFDRGMHDDDTEATYWYDITEGDRTGENARQFAEVEGVLNRLNKNTGKKFTSLISVSPLALASGVNLQELILHETIHAASSRLLDSDPKFFAQVQELLRVARRGMEYDPESSANPYGLSNEHEFIAEAFSNEEFADTLKRLYVPTSDKTIWRSIMEAISNYFGLDADDLENLLDTTLAVHMTALKRNRRRLLKNSGVASSQNRAAEPVDVVYDTTLPAAFSSRSDSESVFINPDLLAETTAGMSERAAANLTRALVSHELAHVAGFKTLTEQDVNDIAATLDDSKLVAVADKYYSATIEDSEQRLQQIKLDRAAGKLTDRDLAHEFIRMHAEKALSGFTSEETASFWRSNPNLVSRFARYLRAFINKLTQRITSVNDSRTAASLNRVTRALAELEAGNVVESVDDAISKAASGDVTFAYAMPVSSSPEYDSRPYWKKLLQSEATPAVKALLDEKSAYAKMAARIAERYTLQMAKHKKAGLITDADSELVRAASGGHVRISKAAQRSLNERYDKSLALIESKFNASEQKKADIVQREAEKIQLDRELEKWTDAEWQKADNEVRSQMTKALDMLPEPVRKTISDMRAAIDVESGKLANDPHLPDDLRASISSNVGIYLTQTYRAFTQTGWNKMLKAGGVAVIGNETVDFTAIKENALKYFAERANETLTARYEKDGLTPSALKAKVNAGVTLEAQRMFDEFIARYEDNAAGLALANASPEAVCKALLTGDASDPVAYKAAADSLKYGQNKYLERKELPEFLRQLLGEVTDPVEATLRTFTTVAMLASNQQFLADLKATGLAGGWMTHGPTTEHPEYEKLASESSPATVSILAGMYGPKEFKQMLDGMFLKSPQAYEDTAQSLVSSTTGLLRAAAGKAMAAKTLLSVGYYSRNALSDWLFFAPFQGIILDVANRQRWKTAAMSSFTGLNSDGAIGVAGYDSIETYIQDLIRLGVLDNDASTTALKQTIGGLTTNPEETLRKLGSSVEDINNSSKVASAISASVGGFNTVLEKAAKVSNTIGAHLKIAVYEHELATLREAYGSEWSDEQMKKEAARKVGLTTQTRSNLAPVVQRFTQSGLGSIVAPFLAFKSEVFRITASTMKLAKEEITSGNDIIAARGKRRLAGMITTTFVLPSLLAGVTHLIFGAAFGDDDDDVLSANAVRDYFLPRSIEEIRRDKALRAGLPEWQQNNSVTFAVTGGKARSLDMTFVNPFALVTDPLWRSFEHVVNGDEDKIAETFARWAGETIIGEQIAAGAITDAFNNRDDRGMTIAGEDLPFHERLLKQTLYVADKGFKPPVASFIYNEITGERGSAKPATPEARNANRLELLAGEAMGVRPRALDLETLAETAMRREAGKLRGVRSAASIATSQYPLAAGEVADSVARINNARVARAQQVRMLMTEYGKYLDTGRLISIGREAGISKDSIRKAVAGYADRFEMRREDLMAVYKAGEEASGTGQQRLTELVTAIQKSPKLLPVQ